MGLSETLGGVETFIRNIYSQFDMEKFEIHFLIHGANYSVFQSELEKKGCQFHFFPKFSKKPFSSLKLLKKFYQQYSFDIIHCNTCTANMWIYFFQSCFFRRKNKPYVIVHSHSSNDNRGISHYFSRFLLNHLADNRYACSEFAGKWMFGKHSFTIIENAINLRQFVFQKEIRQRVRKSFNLQDEFVIGHVGRLEEVKNQAFLIQTFAVFHQSHPHSNLILIGEGTLKENLEQMVRDFNLNDAVIMLPNSDKISEYYQAFDVYSMTSFYEGLPMTVVEAQASGLPCVLSENISQKCKLSEDVFFLPLEKKLWCQKWEQLSGVQPKRVVDEKSILYQRFDATKVAKRLEEVFQNER